MNKFLKSWAVTLALLVLPIVLFFLMPINLAFLTRILIMVILVLSLDLVLGYAGLATLGQAASYGAWAYSAGLFAIHVWADPMTGFWVWALAGAVLAFVSGLVRMRTHGLTLIMLTIAVAAICHDVANKARDLTGCADGLRGIRIEPVLGLFAFDFVGKTGFF